jgi:hypothetical protein
MSYLVFLRNPEGFIASVKQAPYWKIWEYDNQIEQAISQAVAESNYEAATELSNLRRPLVAARMAGETAIRRGADDNDLLEAIFDYSRKNKDLYGGYF